MIAVVVLSLLGACVGSPLAQSDLYDQQAYNSPVYRESSQGYEDPSRYPSPNVDQYRPEPPQYQNRYEKEPQYDEDEEQNQNSIPGEPGKDYPIHSIIPSTAFSCSDKLPGFYADEEAHCQVWHYCKTDGLKESFLCPNGTIYNQENRVCEWWFNVQCDKATIAAQSRVNEDLYIIPPPFKPDAEHEAPQKYAAPPPNKHPAQRRYNPEPEYQESAPVYAQYDDQPRF